MTDKNIGIVNNGKGFKVQLSSKLSDLDSVSTKTLTASDSITVGSGDETTVISGNSVTTGSVTAGNTTVNSDGLTIKDGPSVTKDASMPAAKPFTTLVKRQKLPMLSIRGLLTPRLTISAPV